MEQLISKEEVKELISIEGYARGVSLKDYGSYVLAEKGQKGLDKLEAVLKETGHPLNFKDVKAMNFYPLGLEGMILLGIVRIFNMNDEDIREMAVHQAKVSLLIRLFAKYFFSVKTVASVVPRMWDTFYSIGKAWAPQIDEGKREVVLMIEGFRLVPSHCIYFSGYFAGVLQMVVGKKVSCIETKCIYKGDDHHEFLLKW